MKGWERRTDSFEPQGGRERTLRLIIERCRTLIREPSFWRIQTLTFGVVALHIVLDYLQTSNKSPLGGFVSDGLLVVPTIFASSAFGLEGALATSLLGSVLSMTSQLFMAHTSHEVWAEWTILGIVNIAGYLIGRHEERARVQREIFDLATRAAGIAVWEYDALHDSMRRSSNHDDLYGLNWQTTWHISTFLDATHCDDRAFADRTISESMAPNGPDHYAYDFRVVWPDGSTHWLWVQGLVIQRDHDGRGRIVRGVLMDMTQRKELEHAHRRLQMMYAGLSECNQAVVFAADEEDLFKRITLGFVGVGVASMAWAGRFDEPSSPARPFAYAGYGAAAFLARREAILHSSVAAQWPTSEAATGELVARTFEPGDVDELAQIAVDFGWRSVASLPVRRGGQVVAAVSLYSSEPNFFDRTIEPLLEEMIKDLSFAMDLLDDRRRQAAAEQTLYESEERFRGVVEQSVVGIYIARDNQFEFVNDRAATLLGFDGAQQMMGESTSILQSSPLDPSAINHPHLYETDRERVVTFYGPRGHARHLWVSETPIVDHLGPVQLGLIDNVTALVDRDIVTANHAREIEGILRETVAMASMISERRDPYTAGHQDRVAILAALIGEAMGLHDDRLEGLRMSSRLHDIGKISIPAEILTRPGRLSDMERRMIQQHPQTGYDILHVIPFPWPVALVALQHHERLDGSGYPNGLKGEEIILDARIVAVADVLEAMSSHRPYRASLGPEAAMSEIIRGDGTFYDSDVVLVCRELDRSGRLWESK